MDKNKDCVDNMITNSLSNNHDFCYFIHSGTLRFVVEFGTSRELWSGRKVRKYGLPPLREEGSDSSDYEPYPPVLPLGKPG